LSARDSWDWAVRDAERKLTPMPPHLHRRFREALATEFGEPVRAMLDQAVHGDTEKKIRPLKPSTFVGHLRRALALATLRHQPPDLVILDEFQRYRREILDENADDALLKALLKREGSVSPPAILLLSATPYRLLATRWEEARGALAHEELLELIEFLAGTDIREQARTLFSDFGDKLRDIAAHAVESRPELKGEVDEAARLRDQLRRLLTPVISRTERDSVASVNPLARTQFLDADPEPEDFQVYRHLVNSFKEDMRYEALPYWSSVPLPAQSLGPRYVAWKRAKFKAVRNLTRMTRARRNKLRAPTAWPDAKLRALSNIAPPKLLSLPWVAPSLSWWPLSGGWKSFADPKILMFSRFRATPPSVTALLSFGVEAYCLPKKHGGYEKAYRRRHFKLAAIPGPVMAAFHPSPWLIRNTDPLAKAGEPLSAVRREVRRQILAALPKGIVDRDTLKARRRHRSIARIMASIERMAGVSEQSAAGWSSAVGDDSAAHSAIREWRHMQPIDRLSPAELSDLVDYAIGAPGVALGRALLRHDPAILDPARYRDLVQLSWQGLRAYLDNPIFLSSLPGKSAVEQIMRAVVDGGFESVLDEYFWLRAQNLQSGADGLANDLHSALGLRAGSFSFHAIGGEGERIPVRCHVAVPFGDAETEPTVKVASGVAQIAAARPDEVRQSFNTPFWPHVLATTSVGQEGLDFHTWCSHVVHWDISSNPLDLEQREGRVQRYASLAIRRRLAATLRDEVLSDRTVANGSPWQSTMKHAERLVDESGLCPWWVLDGADISRHVFERPFGRDVARFAQLREQRMIYRLALGQPNQEDFIGLLSRGGDATRALLQPLVLDLSAMGLRTKKSHASDTNGQSPNPASHLSITED
jgi:hypothetical protein